MAPKNIKFIYFDARGRGEAIRLLLALAGQKFEDIRHTMDTWPAEKPNTPFGQAPVIEIDGQRFGQSVAICNYLAREFGFYGKNNIDALKVDQVVQLASDMLTAFVKVWYEKDEAKKAELLKNFKDVEIPKYGDFFEKLLKESGTGYFVGNSLTLADIFVYDVVYNYNKKQLCLADGRPLLKALVQKVESNDKIKAYLANRKETEN